jgi:predicted lipoprotein
MSEGFLFGPVETGGYDPALDAWPFNLVDAQALLAGSDPITPQLIASLDGAVKGFHAIEYLLFGHDGSKAAPALTAACRRRSSGTVERSRRRGKASAISPRRIARRSLRSSVRSE